MSNWKNKPINNVLCPKCNSKTHYFGFNPKYGLQKYRCKKCFHQFTPNAPSRPKKTPKYSCPICGSPMYIFKYLPDAIRLRCSKYRLHNNNKCSFKINIPLSPNKKSFNISTDPIDDISSKINNKFFWNKMSYSKSTVSISLFLMVFCSLDASLTSFILSNLFNLSISHDTLSRWLKKSAISIHKNLGPLPIQNCSELHIDETVFKYKGLKNWLWFSKDYTYDSIQSWLFSHHRSTQFARNLLSRAYSSSPCISNSKIVSDGLWSYASAIADLSNFSLHNHIVYTNFNNSINNNRLERHWSSLKTPAKRFRGFKSLLGLWSFVTSQVYYHNYFKPNLRLNGLTPAEASGVPLPKFDSKWKLFIHFLE